MRIPTHRDHPFRQLPEGARLQAQRSHEYLCSHQGQSMFQLKPDPLLEYGGRRWVLDTKWKLLDAAKREKNYGLSQADFYQLFAYGHRYLLAAGELVLIYPRTERFKQPLEPFYFSEKLMLRVLPFDLEQGCLAWGDGVGLGDALVQLTTGAA